MPFRPAFAHAVLRAGLLALLLSGLMIRPVLSGLSDMHAAEHAITAEAQAAGHGHADDHGHDHPNDHHHDPAPHHPPQPDDGGAGEDHSSGLHGLMHQAGGWTTAELAYGLQIPPALHRDACPPNPAGSGQPQQSPFHPFRPPIA
jgi:hypothetical protein